MNAGAATILVVEDDASTREGLIALLEGEGFAVLGAANGRQALDLLAGVSQPPRLILLDLMMPVMDGWQFLAERRRTGIPEGGPPVVLLSGLGFIHDAPDVADFIRKPIDSGALLACVRRFCGGSPTPSS